MDTQPENDISETTDATQKESAEKLSPQGIASIQGEDTTTATDATPDVNPEVTPPVDPNPLAEHIPTTTDGTEIAGARQIEDGSEKLEKKHYSYEDNEIGGLKHKPSGMERGG